MNKQLIVEALQTCRKYLWDGSMGSRDKTQFICICLNRTADRDAINNDAKRACDDARRVIEYRLGRAVAVETWLNAQGLIGDRSSEWDYGQIQAYRLAWINELIKEFSA